MKITFLGTNGWYDSNTGNTPSVLLDTEKFYIVFDAGFGFSKLNKYLIEDKPVFLFISHFHIDHICGLHTLPKLQLKQPLTIFGQTKLKKYLKIFVEHPFSASFKELSFQTKLVELKEGEHTVPFNFTCRQLQHADPAMGYRLNIDGKTIVYCSDTAICENDFLLAKDADLLIHECAFLPGETSAWGHTNPEQAADLARKANIKKLALIHFGAEGYDSMEKRKKSEQIAQSIFPNTVATSDGLEIEV